MIKRILLSTAIAITVLGLCGGYFYHVSRIERSGRDSLICRNIEISVRDSAINRIITASQIRSVIGDGFLGMAVNSIDLNEVETRIDSLGEVLFSRVYPTSNSMIIEVMPRTAAVRFITDGGQHYYSDATGFLFPVESSVNTPVVTGKIPLRTGKNFKGYSIDPQERQWLKGILRFTSYIESNSYWKEMTSHVNIDEKGEIELYPLKGNVKFQFGKPEDLTEKFAKMELWYKAIAPTPKAASYSSVNLKYDNQIICR